MLMVPLLGSILPLYADLSARPLSQYADLLGHPLSSCRTIFGDGTSSSFPNSKHIKAASRPTTLPLSPTLQCLDHFLSPSYPIAISGQRRARRASSEITSSTCFTFLSTPFSLTYESISFALG
jgi:hypothetical protein